MRAAKVQASLRIRAVSPEPSLLAHTSSESIGTFRQKARSLAPLNGWACAVEICHDGMLEDTNSLDVTGFFFRRSVLIKRTISAFSSGINSPKLHGDTISAEKALHYAQSEPCDTTDSKSKLTTIELSQKPEFIKPDVPTLASSGGKLTFKNLAHSVVRQMSIHDIEKEQVELCPKVEGRIFQYDEQVGIDSASESASGGNSHSLSYEPCHEKTCFSHMRTTKAQISAFVVRCLDRIVPPLAIAQVSRP